MDEQNIQQQIRLAIGRISTMFRNNVGTGWQGRAGQIKQTPEGGKYLVIQAPRPLNAGLCKGSSDLIGWTTREITPEMVGRKIAIFTAIEVKSASGRATPEQINFIRALTEAGGIAGIARDPEGAINIVNNMNT